MSIPTPISPSIWLSGRFLARSGDSSEGGVEAIGTRMSIASTPMSSLPPFFCVFYYYYSTIPVFP